MKFELDYPDGHDFGYGICRWWHPEHKDAIFVMPFSAGQEQDLINDFTWFASQSSDVQIKAHEEYKALRINQYTTRIFTDS